MNKCCSIGLFFCGLILTGCASSKVVHERGWVGGEFARAQPPSWRTPSNDPNVLGAFPAQLLPKYESGLVVTRLSAATPLAKAGLQESDLILALNDDPINSLDQFLGKIDLTPPGTPLNLVVFRDGETREYKLVVGKEAYRKERNVMIAIGLSSHMNFDIFPNPDFSLVALGYENKNERLQLDSAERKYIRSAQPSLSTDSGISSPEGWRSWLAIFSMSGHKKIISQETSESLSMR